MITETPDDNADARPGFALWACPFRIFFLAAAAYAILALVGWLGVLLAGWPLAGAYPPMQWHSHEMLFGMVAAAIAGFLLTAMCNWTGTRPLSGRGLQALFGLWLAGRVAMWLCALLPGGLVAIIDLAFLAAVGVYAGRIIIGSGNWRNLPLVAVVAMLWLSNLLFHAGWLWADLELLRRAELGAVGLITLLMVIVGGRITPAFTRNWMNQRGLDATAVRSWPAVEATAATATALLAVLLLAGSPAGLTAAAAAVAGVANAVRVLGWRGWRTHADPLVWILHAGYAWIPIGLIVLALHAGLAAAPATAWLHALSAGAMGTLIVGVMTRVALGHTGRPLVLPAGAVLAYLLVIAAAVTRLAAALNWLPWRAGILVSAVAWAGAFAVFLWIYAPILVRPRADGRPG